MEWHSDEEKQIVLRRIFEIVRAKQAVAVIVVGTFLAQNDLITKTVLFSSIYQPSEPVFSFGQDYYMFESYPVFGEEISSDELNIASYNFPVFWSNNKSKLVN